MKKVLRFLGILIVILFVGYLILCATSPAEMRIEKSTTINAPKSVVWNQMVDFNNYDHWSPWKEQDSTITSTITGTAGQPGHMSAWVSEKSGSGNMTISSINGDTMRYDLHFLTPMEGIAKGWSIAEEAEGAVKVTNGFSQECGFWSRGMNTLFVKKMLETNIVRGLELLKEYCESGKAEAPAPSYDITEATFPATTFATIRKVVKFSEMDSFFSQSYQALGAAAGSLIKGNSHTIAYKWDQENGEADLAAAFPVSGPVKGMAMVDIPESKGYMLKMVGPYSGFMDAHMAIGKHAGENGITDPLVIEEYVVTPQQEKDSTKYVSHIYYLKK